jgi:ferredoxin
MSEMLETPGQAYTLSRVDLQMLFDLLIQRGYEIVGPRVDQGAIVYDRIDCVADLPIGYTDEQSAGQYRLRTTDEQECFGYNVGPHSWKKYLYPPLLSLMRSKKSDQGLQIERIQEKEKRFAFVGVRACEIAAMRIQDRVLMSDSHMDHLYAQRRTDALIIAVNCTQAASTCFCTSMKTGPRCTSGFDLALTEIVDGFVLEVGSEQGEEIVQQLQLEKASSQMERQAQQRRERAVAQISRAMPSGDLRNKLMSNLNHPHWQDVASRCLSCANCTMVCPTCFCSSVEEVSDLTADEVVRQRRWDSCFNVDFSHTSGAPIRDSIRSRYRQWLTHKLATWIDQFDSSGCVGCGRCITWCPVGIDLTKEVATICGESV